MKICKFTQICFMLVILAGFAGGGSALAADENIRKLDTGAELAEMPLLRGEQWQALQPDTKTAFIWGVGHVVTIEEHVIMRHPEMQRKDFVAKLAEGLRGVPMKSIVQEIDTFYRENPDDLHLPVMRVIWAQIVKPKLRSGIGDQPISTDNDK
jgi:hypothetical protein